MQCDQFRELAESYLNNELMIETNHQLVSHLEHCSDCRHDLTARRELRTKLRMAFTSAPENQMRPEFANHLKEELRQQALKGSVNTVNFKQDLDFSKRQPKLMWFAIAACLLLVASGGVVLIRQGLLKVIYPGGQESAFNEASVDKYKTELARSAVGDHRDCAVHFRLNEKPIDLDVAGREYDPVYVNLSKVVGDQGNKPFDLEMIEAHSCVFESRRFAHIVFKYHGRLVSFLVTDTKGAMQGTEMNAPTLSQSQVIACSQFDGYQVSCFQTNRHAVFVVSDLSETENLMLTRALAPSVFAHITRVERAV